MLLLFAFRMQGKDASEPTNLRHTKLKNGRGGSGNRKLETDIILNRFLIEIFNGK